MVLLEQLFRNVAVDSRWNIKPLCLGLAGLFAFDLYLYSQAVLFNVIDADAFSMRGVVHALVVPLLLLSTSRHSDWLSKIQISRKAAFHSATLMIAGAYLVFVSGVGYYVRYFGGEWGRALQLGLVFRRAGRADGAGDVGVGAGAAARVPGQALLPLPLRLPRGVVALHPDLVGPELAAARWASRWCVGWPTCSTARAAPCG